MGLQKSLYFPQIQKSPYQIVGGGVKKIMDFSHFLIHFFYLFAQIDTVEKIKWKILSWKMKLMGKLIRLS